MSKLREATHIIASLESGDLAAQLTKEFGEVLVACQDAAGPKSKAKGTVTLKLNITVEGVNVEVEGDISSKAPKMKRGRSFFFVTPDGALSTEHPKQLNMFPHEVETGRAS